MHKKTFLFVYSQLNTGGVETLIVRMSNWLVANGYRVKLLLRDKSDLDSLLNSKVLIKYFGNMYFLLYAPYINRKIVNSSFFSDLDVIYSFESITCWLATLIHKNLKYKPVFLTGVYQPNGFYSASEKKSTRYFPKVINKLVTKVLPKQSFLFMNELNRSSVSNNLGVDLFKGKIMPLPVSIVPEVEISKRKPKKYKIISIGRITYFKIYIFALLDVIKVLKNQNIEVEYDIYGHGPLETELINKIKLLQLESNVFFKGKLAYNDMAKVLSNAYLFIGMGTSLVEAAMCGVPSIVAIFNNTNTTCYGFLYNQRNYNVGEIDNQSKEVLFEQIIKDAISWSPEKYIEECNKNFEFAQRFNIDNIMKDFVEYSEKAECNVLNYLSNWEYRFFFYTYILPRISKKLIKQLLDH